MSGICYIIGAGEFYGHTLRPAFGDLTIAADGGYEHTTRLGIAADIVIGDFDSLPEPPDHPNVIRLCKEKDDTDMMSSIKIGLQKGYRVFHIYGGMGGRLDHTIANIQSLAYLSQNGARGFLFGENIVLTAVRNGSIGFDCDQTGYISVFAHSGSAKGVFIKGLKYELENAELSDACPVGVSNEFIGVQSSVSVTDGTLIIVYNT